MKHRIVQWNASETVFLKGSNRCRIDSLCQSPPSIFSNTWVRISLRNPGRNHPVSTPKLGSRCYPCMWKMKVACLRYLTGRKANAAPWFFPLHARWCPVDQLTRTEMFSSPPRHPGPSPSPPYRPQAFESWKPSRQKRGVADTIIHLLGCCHGRVRARLQTSSCLSGFSSLLHVSAVHYEEEDQSEGQNHADDDADLYCGHALALDLVEFFRRVEVTRLRFVARVASRHGDFFLPL